MREVLLPVEIMSLIVDKCPVSALKNLALVSSRWPITAQTRLFRSVHWPDCQDWTREVEIVRNLRPPSHSTLVADLHLFRDIIGESKHLRSMISELYLADPFSRSCWAEGAWPKDVQLVISMLTASGQLRQLQLDSDLLGMQAPLEQYGVTSLIHAPDDYHSVHDAIDYEDLVRFAGLPTLRRLELDYMPRWTSGVRPGCRMQNFSNITTLILRRACLGEDLHYVFAWFKSLQVLEIESSNWSWSARRGREPLHADHILQWLIPQRTSLKKLAVQADALTIKIAQPFGTNLRDFVILEHLVCSLEVLTERLCKRWQLHLADEPPLEIPRCSPEEILPPQLQTLEILLPQCYYYPEEVLVRRVNHEIRRLFVWLDNIVAWKQARFPT